MNRILTALAATLLTACSTPDLDSDPWVDIGTGYESFEQMADGDELDVEFGAQGGQHTTVAIRAAGVDWMSATVEAELLGADGEVAGSLVWEDTALDPCMDAAECGGGTDGIGELVGVQIAIGDPEALAGDSATIRVVVTDADGRTAAGERALSADVSTDW